MRALFLRMENLKYEIIKPLKDHGQEDSFTKLVNSFFKLNPKIKPDSFKCPHTKIMKTFEHYIQCTKEALNEASDYLMMEQIKRSY